MKPESLTGVWTGFYSYRLGLKPSTPFLAIVIDSGGAISGTIHEQWPNGVTFYATLDGSLNETIVRFVKTYDAGQPHARAIIYEGAVNADATKIEGRWKIPGNWFGNFQMVRSRAPAEAEAVPETEAAPQREGQVEVV